MEGGEIVDRRYTTIKWKYRQSIEKI